MTLAIRVEELSKRYQIGVHGRDQYRTLRESLSAAVKRPWRLTGSSDSSRTNTFWALRDVSLTIAPGEVVGIIGRNGAGKSTLLKILSRIVEPTSGRATIRGRVGSLLEVGTGFHPELSGRENVYLNGAILGMTRREITRRFDDIVQFAEVEQFLDTPVKRYSSGMYVRLAFAVAAHLEPEILIVDEVLAVGDAAFQRKCMGRLREVSSGQGKTVLLVSHNMAAIESLCSRAVVFDHGRVAVDGPVADALREYNDSVGVKNGRLSESLRDVEVGRRPRPLLSGVALLDDEGSESSFVPLGGALRVRIAIESPNPLPDTVVGLGVDNTLGHRLISLASRPMTIPTGDATAPAYVDCTVPFFPLSPGEYSLKLAMSQRGMEVDAVESAMHFIVSNRDAFGDGRGFHRGVCVAASEWRLAPAEVRPNHAAADGAANGQLNSVS